MADKLGDGTCTAVDPEDDTLGYTLVTCSGADGFYYKLGAPAAAAGGDSTMMIV